MELFTAEPRLFISMSTQLQVPDEFRALLNRKVQMESRPRSNRVSAMKAEWGGLSFGPRVTFGTKKVPPESPTNQEQ